MADPTKVGKNPKVLNKVWASILLTLLLVSTVIFLSAPVVANHPPGIEIREPSDGEHVSGMVTIWMLAWDMDGNDNITDVWVKIDNEPDQTATYNHTTPEGQWWYFEWDTTVETEGWHSITAIVFDGIDDGSDLIEVYVDNIPDNNPPGIEIVHPPANSNVSGVITIWMIAWDPDGNDQIQDVWVRIDTEATWRNATYNHTDGEGQWWFYEWDTTEVEDGEHKISAIVFDGMEYGDYHIWVVVDNVPENHPPGIMITHPENNAVVSGTITIWMNAWDMDDNDQIQDVWVRIDTEATWRNATYNHTDGEGQWWFYEWDTTEVEDGEHKISAIVFDGMEYGDYHIWVVVDNVPENHPPGIVITHPENNAVVSGTITIWMNAWDMDDNDQIQDVWVRIDTEATWRNATYNHTDGEGQWWYYEWDTTEVEDGEHKISAIVFDGMEYGDYHIWVVVDNVPENHPPRIEIVEPVHGATVSGTITIWMVAWDPDGNDQIQDVWVRIDSGHLRNATYNHTDAEGQWWYYEWDTTEVEDGWHDITAIVFDGLDDGHDVIEVQVQNEEPNHAPGIEIVEPGHGETVSGTVTIWMVAWDPDGNDQIQNVWVRIDTEATWRNATYNHTEGEGQWWFYEWDTTEVEDGEHKISAIVFDGMEYGDYHIWVVVDNVPENHPPRIEIVEPAHGATVSGTITIWMVAWDPDGNDQIQDVWVRIDSGHLRNATYNHTDAEGQWWYYEWDTTEVEDGWHSITAVVSDGEDDGHDTIEVFVVNEEEGFLSTLILLILAILTAMGLIGAVTATEVGKVGFMNLIVLPLYTKISKKDILDHFVRGEIYGYIKVNPGDNYTTIKKNLDLNNGTLTYHLNVLEREGLIKSWNHNGHKYFYPKGVNIPGNGVKNPSINDAILKSIKESPGITVKDIAAVTGISRQLANYHVRKLAAEGKIDLERKSLSKSCFLSSQ